MNKQQRKKILKIAASLTTLGLFIVLYIGSMDLQDWRAFHVSDYDRTYDQATGLFRQKEYLGFGRMRTTWGNTNKGQWHGAVRIKIDEPGGDSVIIETNMFMGKRHGINITTLSDGTEITHCYVMGHLIDCSYFTGKTQNKDDKSSYQYFSNRYSWIQIQYNAWSFDNAYIESYLDTVETIIGTNPVDISLIEDYYDDAVEILEDTPYDSIIRINTACSFLKAIEDLKDYELRRAVVDHYVEDIPTFQIIQTRYSNYPEPLYDEGGSEADFEQFCNDLDDTLALFGPLDLEDAFFYDSIDSWLSFAILSIYGDLKSGRNINNNNVKITDANILSLIRRGRQRIHPFSNKISSSEIAEMVLYEMVMTWFSSDFFRKSVIHTYLSDNGASLVPEVATVFLEGSSSTSVVIEGHVFEDGGAEVTSRGIAWGTIYNPDSDDNTIDGGTGTGSYEVNIEDLTEGVTYYARAFATNEEGTAYGNCISFVPSAAAVSIRNISQSLFSFTLYPDPASGMITIDIQSEDVKEAAFSIMDMNGQVILEHKTGSSIQGKDKIQLDISHIPEGIYIGLLTEKGKFLAAQKLMIVH